MRSLGRCCGIAAYRSCWEWTVEGMRRKGVAAAAHAVGGWLYW